MFSSCASGCFVRSALYEYPIVRANVCVVIRGLRCAGEKSASERMVVWEGHLGRRCALVTPPSIVSKLKSITHTSSRALLHQFLAQFSFEGSEAKSS